MITIKLVDARRGLSQKCRELFSDRRIADQIYAYLCDGIEGCDYAEPERKRGRFVGTEFDGYADGNPVFYEWKCSECGCVFEDEEPMYNFCPNCGADMREGEQE